MGNTCASVHIALNAAKPDPVDGVVRAYKTLGFERTDTAAPDGGKHVVVLRHDGDEFLSVYDSNNADLDAGELQALALAASKIFKSAAVCTSLHDSDTFEFVVFNAGKQIDLVLPDPEQFSGPLKTLTGANRAKQWSKTFGTPFRAEQITQAATNDSVFADDALAELSRLVGITGGQSHWHYRDVVDSESGVQHLHFTKSAPARPGPEGHVVLRDYFDPDNSRMLLVVPASWPVPLGEEVRVTWLMLSEGAGFSDGTLAIRVTGPEGLEIVGGHMEGAKFHNGQIVGPLETAPQESTAAVLRRCSKQRSSRYTLQHKQASIRHDRSLDHFAIASNAAILPDDRQACLDACRVYLEAWLQPLAERSGEIRIHAEKRMTEPPMSARRVSGHVD